MLRRSAADLAAAQKKLDRRKVQNVSTAMRRAQFSQVQRETQLQIADLWKKIGGSLEAARAEAAAAAFDSTVNYKMILRNVPGITMEQIDDLIASEHRAAKNNIQSALRRMQGTSYVPLSKQVYKTQALVSGQVDRLVTTALARGLSARELAGELKMFIDPNVKGGASYAALRLGRSEINNAFHATQVQTAIENEFVIAVKWNRSSSHPEEDECDDYADGIHFPAGGPGEWMPGEVPRKPHPQCLCYMTSVTVDPALFERMMIKKYGSPPKPKPEPKPKPTPEPKPTTRARSTASPKPKTAAQLKRESAKQFDDIPFINQYPPAAKKYKKIDNGKPIELEAQSEFVNPDYFKSMDYKINCQRVVMAAELRARGFDAMARAKVSEKMGVDEIYEQWIDPVTKKSGASLQRYTGSMTSAIDSMSNYEDGARFFVITAWKAGGAHIFNAQKVRGTVEFIEAQLLGHTKEAVKKQYLRNSERGTVRFLRVDTLVPNTRVFKDMVTDGDGRSWNSEKKIYDKKPKIGG